MAKRGNDNKRSNTAATTATPNSGAAASGDALEQRVVAFAEQLGRVVGTVQAKTEGWLDRDALNKQIADVRDSASELLAQMKTAVSGALPDSTQAAATPTPDTGRRARSTSPAMSKGRSGGVVDAPGKKHRKAAPRDLRALAADAKASRARTGMSSMKTVKRRGRG